MSREEARKFPGRSQAAAIIRPQMASDALPSEEQLTEELQRLCAEIGYRAGTRGIEAMEDVPALVGLEIVGGPTEPGNILEWKARREAVRQVLREIAGDEVAKQLDDQYAEAAIKIFRLEAKHALDAPGHVPLGEIQAPLDREFGGGIKAFQNNHRPLILAAMAQALRTREAQAREATAGEDNKPASRKSSKAKIKKANPKQGSEQAVGRKTGASPKRQAERAGRSVSQPTIPPLRQQNSAAANERPRRVYNPRRPSPARRAAMEKRQAERRATKARQKEARAWLKWPALALAILVVVFIIFLATGIVSI
jgi:hypothetical protein